jgi:hypothetical protein
VKLVLPLIAALALASVSLGAKASIQSRGQVEKLHNLITENAALKVELRRMSGERTRYRLGYLKRGRTIKLMDKRIANLDRVARDGIDYPKMIHIASIAYGVNRAMLERRGRCESVNFTDFYNETPIHNGEHAQGAFGFIPSTFASTPFAAFGVLDPLANVFAAAWMHSPRVGRGGEWACR